MDDNKQNTTSFARDLGLFDATMIGVGAMIGAGIFVLTGIAAGEAGPASILAFALNGVVTLLTAFAYAELASAIPRAGGGYSFVRTAFPGAMGFTAGWMLWFAYTVSCSLYALGFAGYFWEFFLKYAPEVTGGVLGLTGEHLGIVLITGLIALFFTTLNARGAEVTGKAENFLTVTKLIILSIFIYFGLKVIMGHPAHTMNQFAPFFPKGGGGVLIAMGLTFIAFEGYDLIATVAEEIKEPEKNIPRATFISLGIAITIYLLILFVSLGAVHTDGEPTWQFLGEYKETAIVRAAEGIMPAFGVALIVLGGLLSTMSALNATILASSRVAFSMARDKLLPGSMAKINPRSRTPRVAIIVTGILIAAMAITMPIEVVGSAASLIFLLAFALVNLALIALRRKAPDIERKYKVPFYPVTPILAIAINLFLALYQFNFQPLAWYVTGGWILVGLLVYYGRFAKAEAEAEPQVLIPEAPQLPADVSSLVVALHNPDNVAALLDLAVPLARQRNLRLVATTVVLVPRQLPIYEGLFLRQERQHLLDLAKEYATRHGVEIGTDFVIAHRPEQGIIQAAERHRADLLIMGWKGFTQTRERIFGEVTDSVIRHAPCDLIVARITKPAPWRTCLFPTSGGPNARLAGQFLNIWAPENELAVTACHVLPPNPDDNARHAGLNWIRKTLVAMAPDLVAEQKLIESDSVVEGLVAASDEFDVVVIGAAKEPLFQRKLVGEIPESLSRNSKASVIVVKRYEGVIKSFIKKFLG